ncbi:hypothetical protein PM082_023416 [Marasmius tenuissimus]|nr:hypothetical protein PM082_023416 [Marasmius tenuissimus]
MHVPEFNLRPNLILYHHHSRTIAYVQHLPVFSLLLSLPFAFGLWSYDNVYFFTQRSLLRPLGLGFRYFNRALRVDPRGERTRLVVEDRACTSRVLQPSKRSLG